MTSPERPQSDCCELGLLVSDLQAKGQRVVRRDGWTVNVYQGTESRPRLVAQTVEHRTSFESLTADERAEMGWVVGAVAAAIEEQPGVERCYVLSFNETQPGHLHVHFVPRFQSETVSLGPSLPPDADPPGGFSLDAALDAIGAPTTRPSALPPGLARQDLLRDSPLTRHVRAALRFWNRHLSPYPFVRGLVGRRNSGARPPADAGERYVLLWLLLLGTLVGLSHVPWWPAALTWLGLALGIYRWADLTVFAASVLLTTERSTLVSVARSLILFSLNVLECFLAAWLVVRGTGESLSVAWAEVFGVGAASPEGVIGTAIVGHFLTITTTLLFGLAVAMIIGKIGDTFVDSSTGET